MDTEIVATFRYRHEGEFAQQLLAANDIDSMLSSDDAGGWYPGIMGEAPIRLVVRSEDARHAREVLGSNEFAG